MACLLSKPDGWKVMRQNLINESLDGRRIVESTLEELESFGYIETKEQPRGEGGRFDSVTTIIHEEPTTGFPAKAQVTPKAETYNGAKDQFSTVVHLPRAEEPRAVERLAVDVPRVKTYSSSNEEASTEGRLSCASWRPL